MLCLFDITHFAFRGGNDNIEQLELIGILPFVPTHAYSTNKSLPKRNYDLQEVSVLH